MRNFRLISAICGAAFTSGFACAADHADAIVDVACSGKPGAKVAIRWGSPNYDSDPIKFMGLFEVTCDGPGAPKTIHTPPISPVKVTAPDSTFEVQTEGGIETSYDITVTLNSQKPPLTNSFHLVHAGSPTTVFSRKGFTMQRTAGPNKYGEQNFRVIFTAPLPVTAKVGLQSGGDRSDAQVALRWGHPNYDSKGYLKLWKVKPGPRQTQQFQITDKSSEFELQTEGGENTTYSMWVWFNNDQGDTDIDIEHSLNTQPDFSAGTTDMTFDPTHGNIYGEGNVKVHAPWISQPIPPAPLSSGLNIRYDNGTAAPGTLNGFIDISFTGSLMPGTSPAGSTGRTAIGKTLTHQALNSGFDNVYNDSESDLQSGSWNVTVSPTADGTLLNPTTCTGVVIQPGKAPFLLIDSSTHSCRSQ